MRQTTHDPKLKTREIAVLTNLSAGGARGLRQFAETRTHPWFFQMFPLHGFSIRELMEASRLDGALVYSGDEQRDTFFAELPIPVVDLSSVRSESRLPRVIVDSRRMGSEAARHLLSKGYQHFAFIGFENMVFSTQRAAGFADELTSKTVSLQKCEVFQDGSPEELPQPKRDQRLSDFLKALPKPCGVYVATDTLALRVSILIRELGLHIPGDLALLGSDNREAVCMLASPPLSSVSFPDVELGRLAAERLAGLMDGEGETQGDWLVKPGPVVERASTDSMQIQDPEVQRALNWIQTHSRLGKGVETMAQDLQLSRRDIERRFRRHLNASPLELIQRERVKLVKKNLLQFELSLEEVAERSGFGDAKWMTTVFRRYAGKTPAAFRRQEILRHSG